MRYDTFLLDLDNTLLDFSRSEREALTLSLESFGLSCPPAASARYAAINDRYWKMLEKGEVDRISLRRLRFVDFCRELSLPCDPDALAMVYMEQLATRGHCLPGAGTLCAELAALGRIYFVTNGSLRIQTERVRRSGLGGYARGLFISEAVGAEKPDRAYFDYVFGAIPDFCAAQTLLVGDSLTSDLQGAYNAGVDGCWYNPSGRPLPASWPAEQSVAYTVRSLEEIPAIARGEIPAAARNGK